MLANILSCSPSLLPEIGENYDRNLLKKKKNSEEGESNGKSKSLNCVLYALFIPVKFARVCLAPFGQWVRVFVFLGLVRIVLPETA